MQTDKTLVEKLIEAAQAIGSIAKDGNNSFQKYKYAKAEDILHAVKLELLSRGILTYVSHIEPLPPSDEGMERALFTLTFTDGRNSLDAKALGGAKDHGDKAMSKANTFGLKYGLRHMLLIDWGDNADPEADEKIDISGNTKKDLLTMVQNSETMEELKAAGNVLKETRNTMTAGDAKKVLVAFGKRKEELDGK